MKQNVLVTGYKKYDFKNENGEILKGFKMSYLSEDSDSNGDNIIGFLPRQASLKDLGILTKFVQVPGIYELNMKTIVGSNNKEGLQIVDLEYIKPCNFEDLF